MIKERKRKRRNATVKITHESIDSRGSPHHQGDDDPDPMVDKHVKVKDIKRYIKNRGIKSIFHQKFIVINELYTESIINNRIQCFHSCILYSCKLFG